MLNVKASQPRGLVHAVFVLINGCLTVILFILPTFGLNCQATALPAVQLCEPSASTHSRPCLNGVNGDGQKKELLIRESKERNWKWRGGGALMSCIDTFTLRGACVRVSARVRVDACWYTHKKCQITAFWNVRSSSLSESFTKTSCGA